MITAVTNVYQYGAKRNEKVIHPFQQYFEDLEVGETLITAKHTVTETDIINFANVSGDNFYAHVDATSLEGTISSGAWPTATGYFPRPQAFSRCAQGAGVAELRDR